MIKHVHYFWCSRPQHDGKVVVDAYWARHVKWSGWESQTSKAAVVETKWMKSRHTGTQRPQKVNKPWKATSCKVVFLEHSPFKTQFSMTEKYIFWIFLFFCGWKDKERKALCQLEVDLASLCVQLWSCDPSWSTQQSVVRNSRLDFKPAAWGYPVPLHDVTADRHER